MSQRDLLKGNEALAYGALKAGLNAYFAYPITPSSEIPETLAREAGNPRFREFKVFLQAASELEAISMVIGAASTGARVMTATSGPGLSLKQEGFSYAAGMELPLLVVDINRAGPGLGNLGPEQSDYLQARGGGHGGHRNMVIAPNSVQEMALFPALGFSLAFKYRNPVVILADAFLGQLKEDIVFPEVVPERLETPWAATGARGRERHTLLSLHLEFEDQSENTESLMRKYEKMDAAEQRSESFMTDDAQLVIVAYGVVSRVCKAVVKDLRRKGIRAGLFRPITLSPFPQKALKDLSLGAANRSFLVVELNMGLMLQDVKLVVGDEKRILSMHRLGGLLPTSKAIMARAELEINYA